jgi:hypothetical protein
MSIKNLLDTMLESNIAIAGGLLVDKFAEFFDNKIKMCSPKQLQS